MKYTLMFIFNQNMDKVLLMHKTKGPYPGCLNGIGGKIENTDKSPIYALYRELREEVELDFTDFIEVKPLVVCNFPSGSELHVFYGRQGVFHSEPKQIEQEIIEWYSVTDVLDVRDPRLAGDGNTAYFINAALIAERASIPLNPFEIELRKVLQDPGRGLKRLIELAAE